MIECPKCHFQFENKLTCLRCGFKWHQQKDTLPVTCANPKCKSPYWNKPRRKPKN
ncbi:Uncharacterised protein [uncultured archaeon]|nr:Uncharacterised protein [uncultured archaeon]